ncbi:lipid-binding SYLF domain-containing protein [Sneathiella sp. CAU 1612]|uniref:Lipid-binding SYLF domain-containing protein n=1 Tax=Sneathiella sedimenti TaxID=2816034 RepID=A0ABS3F2T6_9PROT|nr:lipid-binding SYLF domain-containing protein [Sneathiella sedimenti]MBO0332724.1 lipid-binding SYLF domain-containing protein [Sneathiella sedimenti]
MQMTFRASRRKILSFLGASALLLGSGNIALAGEAQDQLVEKAKFTITNVAAQAEMDQFRKLLAVAKGVVVFPQVLKAGFFVGGAGGSGVLLGKNEAGEWSSPAFYTMGQGSIGLQFGAQANELVLVVMTEKGLQAIISNQVKLGGDLSAAVGPVGTTLGASTTTNMKVDVFSFAISKGLFIGASVEGSILSSNSDSNESYYGKPVTSQQIVIERTVGNAQADGLRAAIKAAEAP